MAQRTQMEDGKIPITIRIHIGEYPEEIKWNIDGRNDIAAPYRTYANSVGGSTHDQGAWLDAGVHYFN